jgi:ABC-type multidrug transport system fused ATPase/permease subunit
MGQTKIKTSALLLLKNLVIALLIFIEVFNVARAFELGRGHVYYITPCVLILTYTLALVLVHLEKIKGLITSTLLFIFWVLFLLFMSITLRTKILEQAVYRTAKFEDVAPFYAFYALLIVMVVLSTFSDKGVKKYSKGKHGSEDTDEKFAEEKPKLSVLPENYSPLLSKLTFWWINNLITKGFKRPLTRDDLWEIDEQESSEYVTQKLEVAWDKATKAYLEAVRKNPELASDSSSTEKTPKKKPAKSYVKKQETKSDEQVELTSPNVTIKDPTKLKKPSLTFCIIRTFGGKFMAGAFIKVVQDLLMFTGPIILDKLITFVKESHKEGSKQSITVGIFYTLLLFLTALIQSFALQHYFHRMFIVGARIRTSTTNLIYKKSLKLSTSARKTATVGEMTNLMSVNAQMLADLTTYLNVVWSSPLQIILSVALLYQYLGLSAIIGVGCVLLLIPLNIFVSNKIKKVQLTKQKQQDSRIKMMNEVLSGIKVLKFYGWELSFKEIIGRIRSTEMKFYKKIGMLSIISNFLWMCAPLIITIVSFGCFILLNDSDKFTANVVFVSLSLFNILRFPLIVLPSIISTIISAQVSMQRIASFLLKEEINDRDITHEDTPGVAIKVEHVDLGWNHDVAFHKDLNMEVKQGKLVAIVGHVGSGKSSLISGLLGEMHKLNCGIINTNGRTAYVPQQAWIQNQTLKNNIIFRLGRRINEERYQKILETCSLISDLKIMPAGENTEIGEKGINLSGGQKQRISLARAIYSDADIYMLDDPLSAVDSHVGKHIFDNVIGPNGILKDKVTLTNF